MARRRRAPARPRASNERWLVSYADFITLLFAFFTTLYAISVVDNDKGERLVRSIRESFGTRLLDLGHENPGIFPGTFGEAIHVGDRADGIDTQKGEAAQMALIKRQLEGLRGSQSAEQGIRVRRTEEGLVISLADTQFFAPGETRISPGGRSEVRKVAELLRDLPNHVRVEGHTDDRPVANKSLLSNWHISVNRAVAIVLELQNAGIQPYRLSASGFADQRPLVSNRTSEGRRMNRRVDLVLLRSHPLDPGP